MGFTVKLYSSDKKPNSTKLPTGLGVEYECVIKEGTTIAAPTIFLDLGLADSPVSYNYAFISAFNRYYYITDWEYGNRLWQCKMRSDVLASFRDEIGNATEYIIRSSYAFDKNITDTGAPMSGESIIIENLNTKPESYGWSGDLSKGRFVIGICNSDLNAVGAVSYYVFTPSEMRQLCNRMLGSPAYLSISEDELSTGLQEALFNPWQYVASAMWFPFQVAQGDAVTSIDFGWWNYDVSAHRLASYGYSLNELQFTIPKHPQYQLHGEYMNREPFSRYSLFIPGFGDFDIPAQYLSTDEILSCQIVTDSISGIATLQIFDVSKNVLATRTAQIGVPIQVGHTAFTSLDGSVAAAASKSAFDWAKVFGSSESSIGNLLGAYAEAFSNFSTLGSNGTLSIYYYAPKLTGHFLYQSDLPAEFNGRPCYQSRKISDIPGYIVCMHGDIEVSAYDGEKQEIRTYLESGFYYE